MLYTQFRLASHVIAPAA